ncbi:MAG: flagellar export chaperone FliS [Gammaproteobacteria bacterium]|nr:flagellar export chaperone FliS [Gammaproteobacteria bacterium]
MNSLNSNQALASYQEMGAYGQVEEANGHELIRLLLETLSIRIAEAKTCIQEDDIGEKITRLTKALNILDGLRMSLNIEKGGEIASNLDDLYDYMQRQLIQANAHNDVSILDEVKGLVEEIYSAWSLIPQELRR